MSNANDNTPLLPPRGDATHVYAYVMDGDIRAAIFDLPGFKENTARWVAAWLEMGRTVERISIEEMERRLAASHL